MKIGRIRLSIILLIIFGCFFLTKFYDIAGYFVILVGTIITLRGYVEEEEFIKKERGFVGLIRKIHYSDVWCGGFLITLITIILAIKKAFELAVEVQT